MNLLIGGIKEASTIDYPGELVSVLFLCNCPFRCPFCHNWALLCEEECDKVNTDIILKKVERNSKYITGICITGGEPTVQIEGLLELLTKTRERGLLNKLDTNGYYHDRLERLLSLKLLDYIALDVKAPLIPAIYGKTIGNPAIGEKAVKNVSATLRILENSSSPYEIRTTIVPNLNDSIQLIEQIAEELSKFNVPRYILQQFRATGGTLDKAYSKLPATDHNLLLKLAEIAKKYIPDVRIRTIEAGEEKV